MSLVEAKCPNCGAKLSVDNEKDAAVCEFCGTPYIVEKAIEGAISNSTINNSVIKIYNSGNSRTQKSELSEEELYNRYTSDFTDIKKSIRKGKLIAFIISLIIALIFIGMLLLGLNMEETLNVRWVLILFGGAGAFPFLIAAVTSLFTTPDSDKKRIKDLNNAYEKARLKKRYK